MTKTRYRALVSAAALMVPGATAPAEMAVYFGTYTGGDSPSRGIYRSVCDPESGALTDPELVAEADNPSFIEIHPNRRFLYAVSESGEGMVNAYAIEPDGGKLRPLNAQPTSGGGPCHVSVTPSGAHVLVANYGGGSVAAFPVRPDGSLGEASGFVQHTGSGPVEGRQKAPHAHSINPGPDGRFAVAADLGTDMVAVYRLDYESGALVPHDPPGVKVGPGAGPRHFAFGPDGRAAYVINELTSTVTVFRFDPAAGTLETVQTVSTLPEGFEGSNSTAEVRVHPSGRFVYGSNRGHDSIAVFAVDAETGKLERTAVVPCGGKTPRNFNLDPNGHLLLVANQGSDEVRVFAVDLETGIPKPTAHRVGVGRPVCIRFLQSPGRGVSLFDGETLDGWNGDPEFFRAEDGAIVAGRLDQPIPRNEFLVTDQPFDNFELRFQAKLTGAGTALEGLNAGVQFWSQRIPDNHEMIGYQADIGYGGASSSIWGWLYDESRRREMLAKPADPDFARSTLRHGDWNDLVIRAENRHIQIFLNGYRAVNYSEPNPEIPARGHIGLQIHSGPPAECRYRGLTLTGF